MKKTKLEKLQKKIERTNFWRHLYIVPLGLAPLLSGAITIVGFIASLITNNFAFTQIMALITTVLTAGAIVTYNSQTQIDNKFYTKLQKLENKLKELTKTEEHVNELVIESQVEGNSQISRNSSKQKTSQNVQTELKNEENPLNL